MSLGLTVDLVEDSGLTRTVAPVRSDQATRVVTVSGLTTGASSDASTALSRALNAVSLQYPPRQPYATGSVAVVVSYQALPFQNLTDDSLKVRVIYDTLTGPGPSGQNGPNLFTLSDDTSTVFETTQLLRDDVSGTLQQLIVKFVDPNNPKIKKDTVANVTFEATKRRIILTGLVLAKDLSPIRKVVNTVNDAPWAGLPKGFWRFADFRDSTEDLGRSYYLTVELLADVNKDWSRYEVLRDPNTQKYVRIAPAALNALVVRPYQYGVIGPGQGIIKVGPYRLSNFSRIFGNQNP